MIANEEFRELVYGEHGARPARIGQPPKQDKPKPAVVARPKEEIYLQSKRTRPKCDVTRVNPEAADVLTRLERQTGQSKTYIASQLIIQGAKILRFCPSACQDCEDRDHCEMAGLSE